MSSQQTLTEHGRFGGEMRATNLDLMLATAVALEPALTLVSALVLDDDIR